MSFKMSVKNVGFYIEFIFNFLFLNRGKKNRGNIECIIFEKLYWFSYVYLWLIGILRFIIKTFSY